MLPARLPTDVILSDLNPPQREAVTHTEGPLLVLAGAGGGKAGPREDRIAAVYRRYQERLAQVGALDFDDLLLLTVRLWEKAAEVLAWYRGLWKYVLVDEYQDTNRAQYRI